MTDLAHQAQLLRALHTTDEPLVLPNAWDATSARAVVDAGFPVVATASNAIAAVLGYPDGEQAPAAEMFYLAQRIASVVDVPVTVDAEAGYGLPADALVGKLVEIGAVGCNIEDSDHRGGGLVAAEERARYIEQMRAACERVGVPLVINARVDTYLGTSQVPAKDRLSETVRRGRLYRSAGADCIFPLVAHGDDLRAIVEQVDAPVNSGFRLDHGSLDDLRSIGVARVSFGPQLYLRAQDTLPKLLRRLLP